MTDFGLFDFLKQNPADSNLTVFFLQLFGILIISTLIIWSTKPLHQDEYTTNEHYRLRRQRENALSIQKATSKMTSIEDSSKDKYKPIETASKLKVEMDEFLFPGNPSKWYNIEQIPIIDREQLSLCDGSVASRPAKTWVSIGGKVFDLDDSKNVPTLSYYSSFISWIFGSGSRYPFLPTITHNHNIIYGKEISMAAAQRDFNKSEYYTKILNLENMGRSERSAFFTIYNDIYITYPIVTFLNPGYDYEKLLSNKDKFAKPNYYW